MSKPPRAPQFDSRALDDDRLKAAMQRIVGKWAVTVLATVIIAAFATGVWASRIDSRMEFVGWKLEELRKVQSDEIASKDKRLADWSDWRMKVEQRISLGDRFTAQNWTAVVTLAMAQRPPVYLPSLREVQNNTPQ